MKIAVFHELPKGGARRVVNDFSKELKKRHQIDLYIVDSGKNTDERDYYSKVYFYKFKEQEWKGNNWKAKLYTDTLELFHIYMLHKKIAEAIDKRKYDIVIVHPSRFTQAPFVLRFLKTQKIYYAHEAYRIMYEKYFRFQGTGNFLKDLYEMLVRGVKKLIDRRNVESAFTIFVNSENTKKNIYRFYSRKSTVCYPGIDKALFKIKKAKKTIDILFIGSTVDNTDGYFDLKNALDLITSKIKLEVVASGGIWIDDRKLQLLYSHSKVVFCGAHNEPFGLIPLEAIFSGCKVVAVNEGGYKETYMKGRTILVERKTEAIANTLQKALRNKKVTIDTKKMTARWSLRTRTRILEKEIENVIQARKKLRKNDK